MEIINMYELNEPQLTQAAQMLTDEILKGWSTLDEAVQEIKDLMADEALLFAALEDSDVLGWCGILPEYDGKVYELHPLVVRHDQQRKGIGSKLLTAATERAREKGALTLMLGSDDQTGETSFGNVNLYDDLPGRIREFKPGTHPGAFYMKHGFTVVGVVPDANGKGKPDIIFAKAL